MKILAIDIGTGTQDIVLFDADQPAENSVKLILPSPTEIAARRVRAATAEGQAIVFTGSIQGGGPCHWATNDHLEAGGVVYATTEAARTFDDDLENVRSMGVHLVSEEEAAQCVVSGAAEVRLRDLDLGAIRAALEPFAVDTDFDGLALGCLDHGNSPPGYSDRLFRFEHLARVVEERNDLLNFAYLPGELPDYLTRAQALMAAAAGEAPQVSFMDTGPAAALGALQDERVPADGRRTVLNVGNMHTLAFDLEGPRINGLYEHHSGEISGAQIADFTRRLATKELTHDEVFNSKGHGTYYAAGEPEETPFVAVTGPQRGKVRGLLDGCFAAPHGDMMVSGCFGLLRGFGECYPEAHKAIEGRLLAGQPARAG
ncbi:MAG: DUF1786 family protein [Dehalococcoidia bacterium]